MKATGVVRRIDDLGRVVIPKEIRKTLRIKERRVAFTLIETCIYYWNEDENANISIWRV